MNVFYVVLGLDFGGEVGGWGDSEPWKITLRENLQKVWLLLFSWIIYLN